VVGAREIIDGLAARLGISVGGTTPDGRFTLETTSCLGVCGVAPVLMIDDRVYGNLSLDKLDNILGSYRQEE
jgi:NADH:ubiquinone oxidoreductase subunit E